MADDLDLGTVGFIGTGSIARSIVVGLSSGDDPPPIRLSPRNGETAQALAAEFPSVEVCSSNAEVVERSGLVIIALRPADWSEVVPVLPWRDAHVVVSLMAGVSADQLSPALPRVQSISRAIPLPAVAQRHGLTAVWGTDPLATALFARLGTVTAIETESTLNALSAASGALASAITLAGTVESWLEGQGLPRAAAHHYVASILPDFHGEDVLRAGGFDEMATEYSTPGGLNEELVRRLTDAGMWSEIRSGLDDLYARVSRSEPSPD